MEAFATTPIGCEILGGFIDLIGQGVSPVECDHNGMVVMACGEEYRARCRLLCDTCDVTYPPPPWPPPRSPPLSPPDPPQLPLPPLLPPNPPTPPPSPSPPMPPLAPGAILATTFAELRLLVEEART